MAKGNLGGRSKQRGMALISALMVLVILAIIAGCFAVVMNRDVRQARNSMYQVVCLNAAQAGLDYAVWLHKHNMACYPLVNYPDTPAETDGARNKVDVPDYFYGAGAEYEYAKGLKLGVLYNLPGAALKSGGKNYDPAADRMGSYTNNLSGGAETKDTEYMFVSDLSFWSNPDSSDENAVRENFLHDSRMCVTFQIREGLEGTSDQRILHIVSTGKIRKVPKNYNWTAASNGWLSLMGKNETGTSFEARSLTDKGFEEYASRTLSLDLDLKKGGTTPGAAVEPDENYASNRQYQMPERKKREWFR